MSDLKLFRFKTEPETNKFCLEIVSCLQKYSGKTADDAIALINAYWAAKEEFTNQDYRLHECPYHWAMCISHDPVIGDNRPDWDKELTLWPPPKAFTEYWYGEPKTIQEK